MFRDDPGDPGHRDHSDRGCSIGKIEAINPIQTGLFAPSPPPLHFLKTIEDINMKLTPLIKQREINLLLLSYLCCDVT